MLFLVRKVVTVNFELTGGKYTIHRRNRNLFFIFLILAFFHVALVNHNLILIFNKER